MKRFFRLVPAVMAAAVISVCSACGAEPPSEESLLTPEELIRAAGLTKEQYRGVDLERFIEDFAITEGDTAHRMNTCFLIWARQSRKTMRTDSKWQRRWMSTESLHGNPERMKRRSQIPSIWYWQWNMRMGPCSA